MAQETASGVGEEKFTLSRTLNLTDAERERRSQLAKRLHAEGRFGGAAPVRIRTDRQRERAERRALIEEAARKVLADASATPAQRLEAARMLERIGS